jgi:predicted nucleic acid-binding protein
MSNEIFLIDTNSFITPHLTYYPFDFAPGFWEQLEKNIEDGKVAILDIVKSEILQGEDSLKNWIDDLEICKFIDHREEDIINKYGEILQSIQSNSCYKPAALMEWSKGNVADAWLIATAAAKGYTLITFEEPNKGLNPRNPSKEAKIPDIAKEFNVKTANLFYMMRELGFSLKQ